MSTPVWISLGSNLGDRQQILDQAVESLRQTSGVLVNEVSSYHETRPVGGPPGQGPFLNAAAHLETDLEPGPLLETLQRIENEAGRVRVVRWGERTLDLDILIYGTRFLSSKRLQLPHPRLAFRRFVLAPLAEIAPAIADPMTKRTITELLANLDRKPRLVAIDGTDERTRAIVFDRLVEELPGFGIAQAHLGLLEQVEWEVLDPAISQSTEGKADALRKENWEGESLRVPWIVADYFPDFDILRESLRNLRKEPPKSSDEARAKVDFHREWKRRLMTLTEVALSPTLVVMLPGDPEIPQRPGLTRTPQLWPESDRPEAIVAEVIATCRGIDGL